MSDKNFLGKLWQRIVTMSSHSRPHLGRHPDRSGAKWRDLLFAPMRKLRQSIAPRSPSDIEEEFRSTIAAGCPILAEGLRGVVP